LTRLLLGGNYTVVGVWSNGQVLTVDYIGGSQIDPFPENPQPPLDPSLLSKIDHIVVLMMENRSFDHMLGYLSKHGGRQEVDGLRGGEKNHYKGRDYPSFPLTDTQFIEGPCHDYDCVFNQVNGDKLDGFVADFAARFESRGVDPGKVMGYYQATQVPVYDALARGFLTYQRWFCLCPGPTFPNRFYSLTGRLNRDANGRNELDNLKLSGGFAPVSAKTIFDHLTDQGVSWHYYEHGYCFLRLFERYTVDISNILDARDPVKGFFAAAQT
jgi:phospholipase C